jgi:peptidyl-prolyl cis-trans isomerase SurA
MVRRLRLAARAAALATLFWNAPALAQAAEPGAAAQPAPSGVLVDGLAAQVGTEVVLVSEVDRIAAPIAAKVREQGGTEQDVAMLRSDVLDKLIERKLILLVAKRAEIEASDFEIDDAINGIARENQLTVEQVRQSVIDQGLTWESYRRRIGEEIVQQKVLGGMVRARAKVEESDIRKLYDQRYGAMPAAGTEELHLVHMAAGAEDGKPASEAAACEKVKRGLSRVRTGEDFDKVASQVSMAAPDLGWLPQHALAPWMQQVVSTLQPGQVSDVIQVPGGCAVLKLVERRSVEALSYEQAKGPLRSLLVEQAFQQEYVRFIERLRKQTYVERKGVFAQTSQLDVASPPRLQ